MIHCNSEQNNVHKDKGKCNLQIIKYHWYEVAV